MRIEETIKKAGHWWIPENPDKKLPGTLLITEPREITLEVLGVFDEGFPLKNYNIPRIVGITEDGKPITLDRCFYKKRNIKIGPGISKAIIIANTVFIGAEFKNGEELYFSKISFFMEGLNEWLSITGISVSHDWKTTSAKIDYIKPDDISFHLAPGLKFAIKFLPTFPGFFPIHEAKIKQYVRMSIESTRLLKIEELTKLADKINNFFCLAMDKPVSINRVSVSSNQITEKISKEKKRQVEIELYDINPTKSKMPPKIDSHNMLFNYKDISANFQDAMTKWLEKYETLEPSFNLYFSAATDAQAFLETEFLALAQALETLHRRTTNESQMPEDDYELLSRTLIKACPDRFQGWLKTKLRYGNELFMRERMKRLIEPFKQYFGTENERQSLVYKITNTRNYLTHYGPNLEQEACKGRTLIKLCMKMEALYQFHLLYAIGFSQKQINDIYYSSQSIRQKLNPDQQ